MPDPQAIPPDPLWFPHRYDEASDEVRFLRLTREDHRRATFITDEYLPAGREQVALARREAVAAAPAPPAPVHFIFHSAFCCSTLLARAFDQEGLAMGLKEPIILNDLVGWRERGAAGRDLAEAMDGALTLLARPFAPGEAVIVKPSNVVNGLIRMIMALRPGAKALFLHAPLPVFLTSVAKKGIDGRLWVRELFIKLRAAGLTQALGFTDEQFFGQTDLQIAAAGWLAQQALFAELAPLLGDRVRTLDSETLLARPVDAVAALARLYGLPLGREQAEQIGEGPAFTRHAKTDAAFGTEDRAQEYRDAASVHGDEIGKVAIWAEAVAKAGGIPLTLTSPLLVLPSMAGGAG